MRSSVCVCVAQQKSSKRKICSDSFRTKPLLGSRPHTDIYLFRFIYPDWPGIILFALPREALCQIPPKCRPGGFSFSCRAGRKELCRAILIYKYLSHAVDKSLAMQQDRNISSSVVSSNVPQRRAQYYSTRQKRILVAKL